MTIHLPRSPRLLLTATAVLATAGAVLLALPQPPPARTAAPPSAVQRTDAAPRAVVASASPERKTARATPARASAQSAGAAELAPNGEGTAGDPAVQQALQAAWPADLPAADERRLLAAGRALLRADATGSGRAKWPGVFPGAERAGWAPAFATAGFRIQAAIARRDGSDDKAVVHLVWAGTDRGGAFTDGRITDWHFTRTKKGVSAWTPQPRT